MQTLVQRFQQVSSVKGCVSRNKLNASELTIQSKSVHLPALDSALVFVFALIDLIKV